MMIQPHHVQPVTLLHAQEHFTLARLTLRSPSATREQLAGACDILAYSHDGHDIWLIGEIRRGLFASEGAELTSPQAMMAAVAAQNTTRQSQAIVDRADALHRNLVLAATFSLGWITGSAMCGMIALGWW
jgi:hypothetical protein